MKNKDYISTNKLAWEEAYDKSTEDYKDIVSKLKRQADIFIPKRLKKDSVKSAVQGRNIAQLACNNGREILSLGMAYHAQSMTGFDLSENMVQAAQSSAQSLELNASFYARNLMDIEPSFNGQFEAVFILIGVLCWFDDLSELMDVASRLLKPGGSLIILDGHPTMNMIGFPQDEGYQPDYPFLPIHSYFKVEPFVEEVGMGYLTDQAYTSKVPFTSFSYTFEDLFKGLFKNKLQLIDFEEGNEDELENFPELEGGSFPLIFYLQAIKGGH